MPFGHDFSSMLGLSSTGWLATPHLISIRHFPRTRESQENEWPLHGSWQTALERLRVSPRGR